MPKFYDPNSSAATLIGALLGTMIRDPGSPTLFPGGVFRGSALSNRKVGSFLVASRESLLEEAIYTTKNRIEIRGLTVAAYAGAASDAQALADALRPILFRRGSYPIRGADVIGIVQVDLEVDETTDFAPKGGDRLHKAEYQLKIWVSYAPTKPR